MASGNGLALRGCGSGAVLQTGPASGFRFLCEGDSCAKKLRKNRWRTTASGGPTAPGRQARAGYQDSSSKGVPAEGVAGAVIGKQREWPADAGRVSNPSGDPERSNP